MGADLKEQKHSFKGSVDRMFEAAAATMELEPGLADQIRTCNSVFQGQFPRSHTGRVSGLHWLARRPQ